MTTQTEKQSITATQLWEAGNSRTEIAKVMKVPNDKELSKLIMGKIRDMIKRHVRIDSRLVEFHDEFPCPVCYPQNFTSRQEEDEFWKQYVHELHCLEAKLKMFVPYNRRKRSSPKTEENTNDIVVIGNNDLDKAVVDVTNLTSKQQDQVAKIPPNPSILPTDALSREQVQALTSWKNATSHDEKIKSQRRLNSINKELKKRRKK